MAKTYYKYAEREVENDINWQEVGQGVNTALDEVTQLREEKRQVIADESRAFGEELANAPTGQHDGLNTFALDHAQAASVNRREQDKLLAAGKISVKEYTLNRQNLIDGTKTAFTLTKQWQEAYDIKMKRMQDKESAGLEAFEMENLESYTDLSNTSLYINPTNGLVNIAKKVKGEDGIMRMATDPSQLTSINSFKKRLGTTYDRFDVDKNLEAGAKTFGTYIESQLSGGVKTLEDIQKSDNYANMEQNYIDSLLVNDEDVSSVLTDYTRFAPNGKPYEYTQDPNKKGPNIIFTEQSVSSGRLMPKPTPTQKKEAEKALKTRFQSMLDEKETAYIPYNRGMTAAGYANRNMEQNAGGYLRDIDNMINGTESQFNGAVQNRITDMNQRRAKDGVREMITDIEKTPDGIIITYDERGKIRQEVISTLDENDQQRGSSEVAQAMWAHLAPADIPYSTAKKVYQKTEGGFQENPENRSATGYKSGRAKQTVKVTGLSKTQLDGTTLRDLFDKGNNNSINDVGSNTQKALELGLKGVTSNIDVKVDAPYWGSNSITVTVDNGEPIRIPYSSTNDLSNLSNEVNKIIIKSQNDYNNPSQSKATPTGGTTPPSNQKPR